MANVNCPPLTNSSTATCLWRRLIFVLLGIFLAAQAVWILVPESYRLAPSLSPGNRPTASSVHTDPELAYKLAAIEAIRGDLWVDAAFATAGQNWSYYSPPADNGKSTEQIRKATIQALRFSPHRGDVWLLFTAMIEHYRWPGYQPGALLKMSYYTAPNELALLPLRLDLALRDDDGIEDNELRELVKRDVQIILTHNPALKPALTNAYHSASATGRIFLERVIAEIDPGAIDAMRASSR